MNKLEKKQSRERKRSIATMTAVIAAILIPCAMLMTACGSIGGLFSTDVKSVVVVKQPTKSTYTKGEAFDTTGMKIRYQLDDKEETEKTIEVKKEWISGDALDASGKFMTTGTNIVLKVNYGGKTATFTVTVNAATETGGTALESSNVTTLMLDTLAALAA